MISLILYIISIFVFKQILGQITDFDAYFLNPSMSTETELKIYFNANDANLGREMKFIFDSKDFKVRVGIMHTCYFFQNVLFMMTCKSINREEDGKWELSLKGDYDNISNLKQSNLTFQNIDTPHREGQMQAILYYTYNGVNMTREFITHILGVTDSPLVTNILSNPVKRESTNIHYVLEHKYTLNYSLDIQMDFPKYSFYDQTVYVIDQFNHEGDISFLPILIDSGGLGPDAALEVTNEESLKIVGAFPDGVIKGRKSYFTLTNLICPEVINKQNFAMKLTDEYDNIPFMNYYNISVQSPGEINVLSFSIDSTRINKPLTFNITFQTDDYKTKKSDIEILLSQEMKFLGSRVTCLLNCENYILTRQYPRLIHSLNPDVKAIVGYDIINLSQPKEVIHSFSVKGLIMSRSTKTQIMNITIASTNNDLMYMIPGGILLSPTKGEITDITITLSNYNINAKGDMIISMKNTDPIIKGDKIQVIFCNEYTVPNMIMNDCPPSISGILSSSKCQIEKNNLTITGISEETILPDSLISFTVTNVKNPGMIVICPINITLRTEEDFLIEENDKDILIDFIPGSINVLSFILDNQTNSAITSYYFRLENNNPIEANGGFEIKFPDESTLGPSITCDNAYQCSVNNQTIRAITTTHINSLSQVSFTISNIKNPRSLKPSGTMVINSISSKGNLVDSYNSDMTIINISPLAVEIWNVAPRSMIANAECGYVFSIKIKEDIIKGDTMIIEIPNDIQIVNENKKITVIGSDKLLYNLHHTFNNNINGNGYLLTFEIQFISDEIKFIPKESTVSFEVFGFKNPNSIKPTDIFEFSIEDKEVYLVMQSKEGFILNMMPSVLSTVAIYPKIQASNMQSDYVIYFKPNIPLVSSDKVVLIYPEEITEVNDQCIQSNKEDILSISLIHDSSNRKLTFALALKNNEFSGLIMFECKNWKSVLNTEIQNTSPFQLYTTTHDDYKKEESPIGLTISFQCFYPCETCIGDSRTQCTKCLSNSLNSILIDGLCHSECPDNYSEDPFTKTCIKCSNSCYKCQYYEPSKCISCSKSFPYFDEENQTCLSNCPLSMFPTENKVCKECSPNCQTCEYSLNKCTSCNINGQYPFMFNNMCYETCPDQTMMQGSYTCLECSSPCKTCEYKPTSCTSCDFPNILLNKQCLDINQCKSEMNYYPDLINRICLKCQEGCQVCGNNVKECVQCKDTHIKKGTHCHKIVDYCLNGYYLTSEKICEKCDTTLCLRCEKTPNTCTSCNSGLFLQQNSCIEKCDKQYLIYNNECVLKCPQGYIQENRNCINDLVIRSSNGHLVYQYPYKISEDYFILLGFSLFFVVTIGVIKILFKKTLCSPSIIAFLCITSLINFILLFVFAFNSGEIKFFYPISIIFIMQRFISSTFTFICVLYCDNDKESIHWNKIHPIAYTILLSTTLIIDYKIFRLLIFAFNLIFFQIQRKSYQSIRKIYCIIAILELIMINLPSIIICIVIINLYKPYSFLYYLSIEAVIIIGILSLLIIIDLLLFPNWDTLFFIAKKKSKCANIPKLNLKEEAFKDNDMSEIVSDGNTGTNKIMNSRNDQQTGKDQSSRILCTNNNKDTFRIIETALKNSHNTIKEQSKTKNENENTKILYTMIENQATDRDFPLNVKPFRRKSIQNGKEIYEISQMLKSSEQNYDDNQSIIKAKGKVKEHKIKVNTQENEIRKKRNKPNNIYSTSIVSLDDIKLVEESKKNDNSEKLDRSIIDNNVSDS